MKALAKPSASLRAAALKCACACVTSRVGGNKTTSIASNETTTTTTQTTNRRAALAIASTALGDAHALVRRAAIAILDDASRTVDGVRHLDSLGLLRTLVRSLRHDVDATGTDDSI
jgi:hypothetical protein